MAHFYFNNAGDVVITTQYGTTHRFASTSAAVNWCNRNHVDAYPQGTTEDQVER